MTAGADRRDAMLAASTAALLHAVGPLQYASWLLALLGIPLASSSHFASLRIVLVVAIVLSLCATWWALRARLDAKLFDALAVRIGAGQNADDVLDDLDHSLASLGLIRAGKKRDMVTRARGARRFALYIVAAVAVQAVLVLGVLCVALLN